MAAPDIKGFQAALTDEKLRPILPADQSEFELAAKPTNGLKRLIFKPCAVLKVTNNEEISKAVKLAKKFSITVSVANGRPSFINNFLGNRRSLSFDSLFY